MLDCSPQKPSKLRMISIGPVISELPLACNGKQQGAEKPGLVMESNWKNVFYEGEMIIEEKHNEH